MRVISAVFLAFASLTLIGASRPLNPLVPRVSSGAAITTECADGRVAPAPRVDLASLDEPALSPAEAASMAPPSGGLRLQLREAQAALERDDRRAFAEALARLRTTLADYPRGGERTAAQHILDAYEDAAVLWDAQFQSPFFSEDSAAYRAASSYPGWAEGVRRNVLVDDRDRRFYPARESRKYLGAVASTRLKQLGVRSPSTPSPGLERDDPAPAGALPAIRPKRRPGKVETHTAEAPSSTSRAPRRPAVVHVAPHATPARSKPSTAAPAVAHAAPAVKQQPAPPPVRTAPPVVRTTPPPPVQTATVAPSPAPVETATVAPPPPAVTDPVTPAPTETTSVTTALGDTTDTTLTTATDAEPATTTATPTPAEPAKGRRLIIPIILILVGIGVLIVLFRTSS